MAGEGEGLKHVFVHHLPAVDAGEPVNLPSWLPSDPHNYRGRDLQLCFHFDQCPSQRYHFGDFYPQWSTSFRPRIELMVETKSNPWLASRSWVLRYGHSGSRQKYLARWKLLSKNIGEKERKYHRTLGIKLLYKINSQPWSTSSFMLSFPFRSCSDHSCPIRLVIEPRENCWFSSIDNYLRGQEEQTRFYAWRKSIRCEGNICRIACLPCIRLGKRSTGPYRSNKDIKAMGWVVAPQSQLS